MNLRDFILFRKKLLNVSISSSTLKGEVVIEKESDKDLIQKFQPNEIREAYFKGNNESANLQNLDIGDNVILRIDLVSFQNYYETFDDFIRINKYDLKNDLYYIYDIDYHPIDSQKNEKVESLSQVLTLISFLKELSSYEKESNGEIELFFHKPDKICALALNYSHDDLKNLDFRNTVEEIEIDVLESNDSKTRRKLFTNEMINLLSTEDNSFPEVLRSWDTICNFYKRSFEIYLSEFSFNKIKTSSQEYFHELTDRIYSTIHKFSAYILAIPAAYLLILRFFDFKGENIIKDSFLLVLGLLYFIIIWFVLLNNLRRAFNAIENDISKFLERIKNEEHLQTITEDLTSQKDIIIPAQKRKICLVKIISLIILVLFISAYAYIYIKQIIEHLNFQ